MRLALVSGGWLAWSGLCLAALGRYVHRHESAADLCPACGAVDMRHEWYGCGTEDCPNGWTAADALDMPA